MNAPIFPTITFDNQKCTVPFYCKKCLKACPTAVLTVAAVKVEKGRETDPQDPGAYVMVARYQDKCTGCNDCIEICPEDAIKVEFPK
ncbi:MAG: 4Fe-4S dicluster domain-containing protein [Proteobacteria bacterium]|nr:4Fe-4S dicluster domain-containing protein [Pseudomonadota bacterium]